MSDGQKTAAVAVIDYPALSTVVIGAQDRELMATINARVDATHDYLGEKCTAENGNARDHCFEAVGKIRSSPICTIPTSPK